jgi:hypothetical protein
MTPNPNIPLLVKAGLVQMPEAQPAPQPPRVPAFIIAPKVRAKYCVSRPSQKECLRQNICVDCRERPALFYGEGVGYAARCDECGKRRRAHQ